MPQRSLLNLQLMGPYQNNGLSFFLQRCNPENVNSLGPFSVVTEQVVIEVNLFCFFQNPGALFSWGQGIKLFYYVRSVVLVGKGYSVTVRSLVIILTVYVCFMLEVTYFDNLLNGSSSAHLWIIFLVQYFDKRQVVFVCDIKQAFCKLI